MGIFDRVVIDNHFIPCSDTRSATEQHNSDARNTQKSPFTQKANTTFKVLQLQKLQIVQQAKVLIKDNVAALHTNYANSYYTHRVATTLKPLTVKVNKTDRPLIDLHEANTQTPLLSGLKMPQMQIWYHSCYNSWSAVSTRGCTLSRTMHGLVEHPHEHQDPRFSSRTSHCSHDQTSSVRGFHVVWLTIFEILQSKAVLWSR